MIAIRSLRSAARFYGGAALTLSYQPPGPHLHYLKKVFLQSICYDSNHAKSLECMALVAIPAWDGMGRIPPLNVSKPAAPERSPYPVALTDFILRFGDSQPRRDILRGFLQYRQALHATGLIEGFQWLDGSFLEHIELLEKRAPNDLDVVTFYKLPIGKTQTDILTSAPDLFEPASRGLRKSKYHVDAYLQHLGGDPGRLVQNTSYWYSMWSHRRNGMWKGFVQVDLAAKDDSASVDELDNLDKQAAIP